MEFAAEFEGSWTSTSRVVSERKALHANESLGEVRRGVILGVIRASSRSIEGKPNAR